MKYVSSITIGLLLSLSAFAERKNSGEYITELGNQWANQPQGGYELKYHAPQPNYMVRQGEDGRTTAIKNLMMQGLNQGGSNGNTYNNYFGNDGDE